LHLGSTCIHLGLVSACPPVWTLLFARRVWWVRQYNYGSPTTRRCNRCHTSPTSQPDPNCSPDWR